MTAIGAHPAGLSALLARLCNNSLLRLALIYSTGILLCSALVFSLSYYLGRDGALKGWSNRQAAAVIGQVSVVDHELEELRTLFGIVPDSPTPSPTVLQLYERLLNSSETVRALFSVDFVGAVRWVYPPGEAEAVGKALAGEAQRIRQVSESGQFQIFMLDSALANADVMLLSPRSGVAAPGAAAAVGALLTTGTFNRMVGQGGLFPFDQIYLLDDRLRLVASHVGGDTAGVGSNNTAVGLLLGGLEQTSPYMRVGDADYSLVNFGSSDYVVASNHLVNGWHLLMLAPVSHWKRGLRMEAWQDAGAVMLVLGLVATIALVGAMLQQMRRSREGGAAPLTAQNPPPDTGQHALLTALVDHVPSGVFFKDLELRYRFVNRTYAEWFGKSECDFIGRQGHEVFPAEVARAHREHDRQVLESRQVVTREEKIQFAEQVQRLFYTVKFPVLDSAGNLRGIGGTKIDLTESRAVQAQLEEAETRFRVAVEASNDGIINVDDRHRVVFANRAASRLFGYADGELDGDALEKVLPDLDIRSYSSNGDQARGGVVQTVACCKSGTRLPVEVTRSDWETHGQTYATYLVRDISDRLRLEAQLVQSQKMESLGQLTGGIAHDFNNLLQVILGNIEIIQTHEVDPHIGEYLARVQKAGRRGSLLVGQLLSYARKQTLSPVRLDVNEVIRSIQEMLDRAVGADIEFNCYLHPNPLWINADLSLLESSLVNLIVNARDAMPDGGRLVIRSGVDLIRVRKYGTNELPPVATGQYVRIEVQDWGCGIPAEALDRVFDPFFTTKDVGRGTGLGLSMVYGFISQSGGQVEIDSVVNRGTTVRIFLPLVVRDPDVSTPGDFTATEEPSRGASSG